MGVTWLCPDARRALADLEDVVLASGENGELLLGPFCAVSRPPVRSVIPSRHAQNFCFKSLVGWLLLIAIKQ